MVKSLIKKSFILLPKFKQSSRLPTWLPDARDISKTGFKQVKIMKEFV
jgi:hypothetical protein